MIPRLIDPTTMRPHTERWAYQKLYRDNIFALATRLYPWAGRGGARLLCRSIARFYALTQPAIRRVVRQNLALLQSEPVTDRDALQVFLNYAETLADYVGVGRMNPTQAQELLGGHTGAEHLEAATGNGRGVILATGHYGFFEFGSVILAQSGGTMTVATLPEPTTELTEWRAAWRRRWGAKTIAIGRDPFSALNVARALSGGDCMAMLADRPFGARGIPVELPGGRIPFSLSPALLAWMTGCEVLPSVIVRQPDRRYRIITKPPVTIHRVSHPERDEEVARATREIADSLFTEIQRDPRQWYQFVPLASPSGFQAPNPAATDAP